MKTKLTTASLLTTLLMSGCAVYAQDDTTPDSTTYKIETRLSDYTRPTTFTPTKATPVNGAITENIITSTERILNKEAPFLKKGVVKAVGEEQFSAWEMVSDEGGRSHSQTAPNPLTYYAAGAASSLLTQVERAAQILNLDIDDVKVETEFFFRWADTMSANWSGYTDKVVSNIIVTSNESPEKIKALKEMALKAWAVGEGLANKTTIDAATVINGDNWEGQNARPGKVGTPVSIDNGRKITDVTPDLTLQTIDVKEDLTIEMGHFPETMAFSEIGIAESVGDAQRPYLHKIRAKSLTENYATWELYTDDSRGYQGINKAPTSRDYFTLGTSFCLMSQLTASHMLFDKQGVKIDDFRVEHQFDYQQDNFMTPTMTGYLNDVITRIVIKSDADKEMLNKYANLSLSMCFAGEGIMNETEMDSNIYLNGKIVK